jgi:hypothetical protein
MGPEANDNLTGSSAGQPDTGRLTTKAANNASTEVFILFIFPLLRLAPMDFLSQTGRMINHHGIFVKRLLLKD